MPLSLSHGERSAVHRRWARAPHPRRSRRTALPLAAVLLAAPLLSACGDAPRAGAAAVVDGSRITVSELQSRAADVRDAQAGSARAEQLVEGTGQLHRAALNDMIFRRVVERAAEDAGVDVSRREIQQARTQAERGSGGAKGLREVLLNQYAVAPGQIEEFIRGQLLVNKLTQEIGADSSTPEGQQKVGTVLREASRAMSIDVNPRYGDWDDKKVVLGSVREAWLRETPGEGGGPA